MWTNTQNPESHSNASGGAKRRTTCPQANTLRALSLSLVPTPHKNSVCARLGERGPVAAARSRRCGGSGVAVWARCVELRLGASWNGGCSGVVAALEGAVRPNCWPSRFSCLQTMFFTTEVFLNKKTPISRLWFAGHSNQYNSKRLPRRILAECDIIAMTKCVMEPEEKLALRFSSVLMHGCARIHSQKQRYMWDDMIAAKEKLMQNAQSRSLEHINKKTKFEATTLSDVHASEMMLSFNENDFLNAEMAAEVYVLPKFTPTQSSVNSSLRDGNSSLSHAHSNRGLSTPHAAMAAVQEVEADGEYPSCGIIDFGNVMDQDPGFFDDIPNVDNGSEFPVGFDDNSTIHAASVAAKPSGKSGQRGKASSKRPRFDAKTVSFYWH